VQLRRRIRSIALPFIFTSLVALILLSPTGTWAAGEPIGDHWKETPALQMIYFWNLKSKGDGKYKDEWPADKLAAVDTYLFGLRHVYLDMDITGHIAKNHQDRVWVEINNTMTNYPDKYHERQIYDYPPHINVHLPWREPYWNDTNGHFYTSDEGKIEGLKYHYKTGSCPKGDIQVAPDVWTAKRDSACKTVYEERYTTNGELQLRINANSTLYTLRNKGVSNLDVLRGSKVIYNVQRTFYDAAMAKVVWKITNYERQQVITETILANPDTGKIASHTKESKPLPTGSDNPLPAEPSNPPSTTPNNPPPAAQLCGGSQPCVYLYIPQISKQ
jgi:hypothetical protein